MKKRKELIDWEKVSNNKKVIKLIKKLEDVEEQIRVLDNDALLKYYFEVLGQEKNKISKTTKITPALANNLKPCPFCGEQGIIIKDRFYGRYYPKCSNDSCIAGNMAEQDEQGGCNVDFKTEAEAVSAWNSRNG